MYDAANGIDSGIDRTVARSGGLELLAGDVESDAGYRLDAHACRHLQEVETNAGIGGALFPYQHEYIVVVDVFLAVGQFEEGVVGLVECLFFQLDAQQVEPVFQGCPSAAGRQYNRSLVDAYLFGVDNLVAFAVFQYTVLMNARGVGKGVAPHDGLVGLYGHVHEVGDEPARAVNLLGIDVGLDLQVVVAFANHGYLFERGVPGPFANTVDGYFGLTGAVLYTRHRVGRGHAQVVVAVGGDNHPVYSGHVLFEVANLAAELVGQAIAGGVGYVDNGSPGLDDGLDHAGQVFVVGAACIFGIELNVLDILFGIFDRGDSALDNLLAGGVELVFDVVVRSAYAGVYTFVPGILQGFGRYLYIVFDRSGKGTNGGPCHRFGDGNDRFEIAGTGYRKSCFYDVDAKGFECFGYLYFFNGVELTAGDLLAVS